MVEAVLDHLWQSTCLALGIGLLAVAFRKARAAIRYGLWFTASTKFLIPFAAVAALGKLLTRFDPAPIGAARGSIFIEEAAQPFSRAYAEAPIHAAPHVYFVPVLGVIWALGSAAVLIVWAVRWARVRSLVRAATPLPFDAPMPVLASPIMLEPGLVGILRPVLIVPASLPDRLSPPETGALVAHEACHLRRHDNLTAAIHMLVESLFWFHPLVWWIGARLIDERERACDEAVVQSGHDRAVYARSLVECCRLYLQSPLPCVAGASGSDLKRRVEAIMAAPPFFPVSRCGKALLFTAAVCAITFPVAVGWLESPAGHEAAVRVAAIASNAVSVHMRTVGPAAQRVTATAPEQSDTALTVRAPSTPDPVPVDAAPSASPPVIATPAATEVRPFEQAANLGTSKVSLAPDADLKVPEVSLTPIPSAEIANPPPLPVANFRTTDGKQPIGPGHYEQTSGPKKSGDCHDAFFMLPPRWYTLTTPPIAAGHEITHFQYELRGEGQTCDIRPGEYTSQCQVILQTKHKRTVEFLIKAHTQYCDYSGHMRDTALGLVTPDGVIAKGEMVFSYDVQ